MDYLIGQQRFENMLPSHGYGNGDGHDTRERYQKPWCDMK